MYYGKTVFRGCRIRQLNWSVTWEQVAGALAGSDSALIILKNKEMLEEQLFIMAVSLAGLILLGLLIDFAFRKIRIPGLVGMLCIGILLEIGRAHV